MGDAHLKELAVEVGAAVTGSMVIRDGDKVFNRLLFATPDAVAAPLIVGGCQMSQPSHTSRILMASGGSPPPVVLSPTSTECLRILPPLCQWLRLGSARLGSIHMRDVPLATRRPEDM